MNDNQELGQKIKTLRLSEKLTLVECSEITGLKMVKHLLPLITCSCWQTASKWKCLIFLNLIPEKKTLLSREPGTGWETSKVTRSFALH